MAPRDIIAVIPAYRLSRDGNWLHPRASTRMTFILSSLNPSRLTRGPIGGGLPRFVGTTSGTAAAVRRFDRSRVPNPGKAPRKLAKTREVWIDVLRCIPWMGGNLFPLLDLKSARRLVSPFLDRLKIHMANRGIRGGLEFSSSARSAFDR